MKETLVSQLKAMKQEYEPLIPRADFKRTAKDRVFSYCNTTAPAEVTTLTWYQKMHAAMRMFVPAQMLQMTRTLASIALICSIGVGGWIASVSASYQSVPGDALYNVKLATERVQIVVSEVTQEKTKTAKLHTEFAARRAEEVQRVIEKKKEPEQAKAAMQLLAKSVDQATAAIQQAEDEGYAGTDVLESTKQLLSDTEKIIFVLQGVLDTLPAEVIELVDEIIATQGDLTEKRLSALEDIIANKIDGRIDLSEEEIITIVESSIALLRDRATANEAITKELQGTTESTSTVVTSTVKSVSTTTVPTVVTTTITQTSTIGSTTTTELQSHTSATATTLNIGDVEAKTTAVQETLSQVDTLIQQGDLIGALEKAKQANVQTSKVEQVVKKASVQAKEDQKQQVLQQETNTAVESTPDIPTGTTQQPSTTTPGENTTTTLTTSTSSTPKSAE